MSDEDDLVEVLADKARRMTGPGTADVGGALDLLLAAAASEHGRLVGVRSEDERPADVRAAFLELAAQAFDAPRG